MMFDLDFLKTCTAGFGRMTDEAQDVLRQTVSSAQKPDGLFPGRSGHGDIYYTLFGLCLRCHLSLDAGKSSVLL